MRGTFPWPRLLARQRRGPRARPVLLPRRLRRPAVRICHLPCLVWAGHGAAHGHQPELLAQPFFEYLSAKLADRSTPVPLGLTFEFNGGYVGYLGYELKSECGGSEAHRSRTPDAAFFFADRMLVLDHAERASYLLCLSERGAEEPTGAAAAADWLRRAADVVCQVPQATSPVLPKPLSGRLPPGPQLHDRDSYLQLVDSCLHELRNGESYEICLTRTIRRPTPAG
jgi:para-aminobenzoate synthetase